MKPSIIKQKQDSHTRPGIPLEETKKTPKKQSLIRNILELDFKKVLKEQIFNQKGHFIKLKMLNLDVIQILDSSTIIMGHFENSGSGYK